MLLKFYVISILEISFYGRLPVLSGDTIYF